MKKRLSIVSMACACALVLGLASGCSNGGSGTGTSSAPAGQSSGETAGSGEEIVIRYMTWEDGDWQNFTQEFIDKYMEENPGIKIQYEPTAGSEYMPKLQSALASNNEPDVMWVDQWVPLFQNDMFEDLKPLAEAQGYDLSAHNEEHLKMATYNDKLYGLTGWAGVVGVIYNTK